jgi:Tol biopolymer transport system component
MWMKRFGQQILSKQSLLIQRIGACLLAGGLLVACGTKNDDLSPIPTEVSRAEVAATLGVPPQADIDRTLTLRAQTRFPTQIQPTDTISVIDTLQPTFTETNMPSPTPNPIQMTETEVYGRQTRVAGTASAPPPPTITPTASDTPLPLPTPTLTNTPLPTPQLPDNPTPNGIIFTSDRAGTNDIWVMRLVGEPASPILITEDGNENVIACHPQGGSLVFDSDQGGDREIYLTDYIGTSPRPLTDTEGENFNPAWSPEGDTIAFVSTRTGDSDIWLMDSGGGNVRPITSIESDEILPSWSADGHTLFYSSNREGNFDIYSYSLDTDEESQITNTSDVDELYPVLSPDFVTIAYVAEITRGDSSTGSVFIIDANGDVRPVVTAEGRVEMPVWTTSNQMLVAANLNGRIQILFVDLVTNTPSVLTTIGQSNQWPRYCFVEEGLLDRLPEAPPTPAFQRPTPTLPPIAIPNPFQAVEEPQETWLISRETWTGDEFAIIAPDNLPAASGFLVDNLVNLAWEDAQGRHVVTMALEADRGDLLITLVGYTINDLPGPIQDVDGFDQALRTQILRNSLPPGNFHLAEVEITTVNVTLTFRVPILSPNEISERFTIINGDLPNNLLISRERWSATEFALVASVSGIGDDGVGVTFVGDQAQYRWQDNQGDHLLVVSFVETNGDLAVVPTAYTIDGESANVDTLDDTLMLLRDGILANSIQTSDFLLQRVAFSDSGIEFIFLVPPA